MGVCFLTRLLFFLCSLVLKFALYSCKIETTFRVSRKETAKKSLEKYVVSDLGRNTEEMQCIQRQLLVAFIYFVCGCVCVGRYMMYALV